MATWPRNIVPALVASLYTAAYGLAWLFVWQVHRTDPGDGLEYLYVLLLTLPWCALPIPGGYAIFHISAALNAAAIYVSLRWLVSVIVSAREPRSPSAAT